MQIELSQAKFEQRLAYVTDDQLAYVDIKEQSPFVLLVLHEHLGLTNYIRIMAQAICNNELSIFIPNLFSEAEEGTDDNGGDTKYLKELDQTKVATIVLEMIDYLKQTGKRIILMGFSLGASMALKLLEHTEDVDLAFLFYGIPPLQQAQPDKITCKTTVVIGSKDKIKYMSDPSVVEKAKKIYSSNKKVEIVQLSGAKHGFMNPASQYYSQEHFNSCCEMFQRELQHLPKENQKKGKKQPVNPSENRPTDPQNPPNKPNEQEEQQKKDSCSLI